MVTQLTGIIPDPQTNPSKTDTSTIFTSKSKSVLTCFSNFLSDKHGFYFPSALTLSPGLRTLLLESRLDCPLPTFAISLASSALDGAADISQMQHEESACVLRSMPRNPLHPYFSINHRIFFGQNEIVDCLRRIQNILFC